MTKDEFFEFFEKTTAEMIAISRAKNADYTGIGTSPFANFERPEQMGICSTEQGFLTRMCDKLSRIASFCAKGELQVKDESVMDTLKDNANYSILMMGFLEQKRRRQLGWNTAKVADQRDFSPIKSGLIVEKLVKTPPPESHVF